MPVRLGDLADVHGAMLVHGEATPARHHLDDLLTQQEGVLPPLGGSGAVTRQPTLLHVFGFPTLQRGGGVIDCRAHWFADTLHRMHIQWMHVRGNALKGESLN